MANATGSSKIRVALVSPKGPLYRKRSGIFSQSLRYMPLTLPTLAALIPSDLDIELVCVDEGIEEVDLDLDVDLVGLTVITGTAPRAYELSAHFRSRGITTVLGGPHVTLAPDDAQPHADSIVVGYAEATWPQLLYDFASGELSPRYKQDAHFDIAQSPIPDRSVLPRRKYVTSDVFEATRGCIHSCTFCVVPSAWGRTPFQKPIEDVVRDITQHGAKRAIFIDLNIIAERRYAKELFTALKPLNLKWYGLATTLLCDDIPLLDLAAESGCRGLLMGLESISTANLASSQKRFNDPDSYGTVVSRLHERNISLQGCFVFGLDEDQPTIFEETAELAVDLKIDLPRFAILTPFPGTPLFDQLDSQGRILTENWELYDGQHVVFEPKNMTVQQLQDGNERAWKIAYRWDNIARRLTTTGQPLVSALTNYGYRRYGNNLSKFYNCDWILPPERLAAA